MTHGTSYKFSLLERYIIRSSWEIVHNSSLENPLDQTGGIGKRTQRATTDHYLKTGRSEITELQLFQYRSPIIKKRKYEEV